MEFDVLFKNATVVDGSGRFPYTADVAVSGEKVAVIGDIDKAEAKRVIDAKGKVLCPGFIDIHSHADMTIPRENHAEILEPLIRQGITTFVGGNCGMGFAPLVDTPMRKAQLEYFQGFTGADQRENIHWDSLGEFLDYMDELHPVMNFGLLAPHGVIRLGTIGAAKRLANREEVSQMTGMLRECMEAGALGMSTGLQYFPGSQCDTEELIELGRVLYEYDGVMTSHLRSYSDTLELAIDELKEIIRKTGIRGQISHLFWLPDTGKVGNWLTRRAAKLGSKIYERVKLPIPLDAAVAKLLDGIDREIQDGLPLGIDGMPTSAGFTHLIAFFPPWVIEDEIMQVLERLKDPALRKRMRNDIENGRSIWPHREDDTWSMNLLKILGYEGAFIMSVVTEKNKHLEGKNLVEVGKIRGQHPFDAACDLLLEEDGRVLVFETVTRPGDDFVERSLFATMKSRNVSIVTDTILMGYGRASHLFYDCYPKYIARYVRDYKSVSLAEGIRKCTSLPASQLQLKKRGEVREGYFADLVMFDLTSIDTKSSFEKPDVYPQGIETVLINGKVVFDENGYHPEPRSGRVIRREV